MKIVVNHLKEFYRHCPELMVEEQVPLTFLLKVHANPAV